MGLDEARLIESAQAGDGAAMQQLLLLYDERLLAYIESRLPPDVRQVTEPDDVLQDTLFEASRCISQFSPDGEEALFRWLVTIARHRIVDLVRRQRPNKGLALGAWTGDEESVAMLLEQLAVYERTPSQSAISHETVACVQAAIDKLPSDMGEVIRLRYISGLSAAEAGDKMGRSEGAVRVLAHRALQELSAVLQPQA